MKKIRIISRLDIKGPNVVKPIHTEALRVVGNPEELAERYYKEGADELIYLDIVASLYQRNLDFDLLKLVTKNIFIPITVGGGIRSIQDINYALRAGADKIAINTHAVKHPEFIAEAVKEFGSQCVVLFVEAKKQPTGNYEVYTEGGRERTSLEVMSWIKTAISLGIGEILISSIDQDGTRKGYDMDLIKDVISFSPVPVIVHGGAGSKESIKEIIHERNPEAVAASSVFHYHDFTIRELKEYLVDEGFNIRL